jgi:hypothetical protein
VHLHPGGGPLALVCLTSGDAPVLLDCDTAKLVGHLPLGTPSGEALPAKGKAGGGGGGSGGGGKGPCVGVFADGGDSAWVGSPSGSLSLVRLGPGGATGSSVERCQRVCPPGLGVRHLATGGPASRLVAVTTGGRRILVLDTQAPPGAASEEQLHWRSLCECEDAASSGTWACSALSPDGRWLVGAPKGSAGSSHLLLVWDLEGEAKGRLHHVLEAPPGIGSGAATRMAWHPQHRLFLSLASAPPGRVLLWAPRRAENWSAFAPDFRELEENEEHCEREDEFDVQPAPATGDGHRTGSEEAPSGPGQSAGGAAVVDVFTMPPRDPEEPPDALLYLPFVPRPPKVQPQQQVAMAGDAGQSRGRPAGEGASGAGVGAEQPHVGVEAAAGGKRQRVR